MDQKESVIQKTYDQYGNLVINRVSVEDTTYKKIANSIYTKRDFQLKNLTNSGRAFFQLCKNVLYLGRTEPLPAQEFIGLNDRAEKLFNRLNDFEKEHLEDLRLQLLKVFDVTEHHFEKKICEISNEYKTVCLLHKNESYENKIIDFFDKKNINVNIKSCDRLDFKIFYDAIVCLGKPEWYSELLSFPPTKNVFCLMYDWDFTNFNITEMFPEIPSLKGAKPEFESENNWDTDQLEFDYSIDDTIDRELIKSRLNELEDAGRNKGKIDSSILTLQDDQYAVLVPNTPNYELEVLKKDEDAKYDLVELPTSSIRNGMWYLYRGFSSDELKKKLSRKKFGEKYITSVSDQKRWKDLLSEKIRIIGVSSVVSQLKAKGAQNARDYNVKNWASYSIIRPGEDSDLKAILDYVNTKDDFEKIATSAEVIKKCHKKMGFHITEMLKKEIKKELIQGDIKLDDTTKPIDVYLENDDKTKMTLYPITSRHQFGEIDRVLTHQVFSYI